MDKKEILQNLYQLQELIESEVFCTDAPNDLDADMLTALKKSIKVYKQFNGIINY